MYKVEGVKNPSLGAYGLKEDLDETNCTKIWKLGLRAIRPLVKGTPIHFFDVNQYQKQIPNRP